MTYRVPMSRREFLASGRYSEHPRVWERCVHGFRAVDCGEGCVKWGDECDFGGCTRPATVTTSQGRPVCGMHQRVLTELGQDHPRPADDTGRTSRGEEKRSARISAHDPRGQLVREWRGRIGDGNASLYLYDLDERDPQTGHHRMAYRLLHGGDLVFAGDDYAVPAQHAVDSDEAVRGLLGFLSLRPGDTDAEYFDAYTDRQRSWADQYGEELALHADPEALAGEGEAPTMDAALDALQGLRAVADRARVRVDRLAGSLRSADLDEQTLDDVAAVLDAADAMKTAAAKALTGLQDRHGQLHEAVNTTQHTADTDWYRH